MARQGQQGTAISLGIKFYRNGVLYDPYQVNDVKIYTLRIGGSLLATLTPDRISDGYYEAIFNIDDNLPEGTYYDEWSWVAENGMSTNTQRYAFEVTSAPVALPPAPVISNFCDRPMPEWLHLIGIRDVQDVGNGMGLRLYWEEATLNDYTDELYYNVYYSRTRFGVFNEAPKAITRARSAIINVEPGLPFYCAIRATEFERNVINIESLPQIGSDLYKYPEEQPLAEAIESFDAIIKIADNSDFPSSGYLQVGYEYIRYSTKGVNEFSVQSSDRGMFGSLPEEHAADTPVSLYRGTEDMNTSVLQGTAAWFYTNGIPRNTDALGETNVDEDGYRAANEDTLTTNFVASDESTEDFPSYDYSGYHRPSIQDTLSGECVNSYVGGEFNGTRGFNYQERLLSQLDALLQTTGEPAILLRRKWTGPRCRCISLQREHPRDRCPYCFGVGFNGGYDRFVNTRPISEKFVNTQGMIMIRITPFTNDLEIVQDQGLRQPDEITAWTLTFPTVKDRDILVRFTQDGIEEFRYEVLSVTRNKLFFGQSGRQELKIRKLDKTDVVYQYNTIIQP